LAKRSTPMAQFIFFTGGVVSSLGKGITAASLGRLLKSRGVAVSVQNWTRTSTSTPERMNPYQHGEVFVTEDGAETDLDLGHYERFIDESLTRDKQRHDPVRSTSRSSRRSAAAPTSGRPFR